MPINSDQVAAVIANGHAFTEHVEGIDSGRNGRGLPQGVNEFTHTRFGGRDYPDLGIANDDNGKRKFAAYLADFLQDPDTKGFADPRSPGKYVLYNSRDNTLVFLDKANPDYGTIYRPDKGAALYQAQLDDAFDKAPPGKDGKKISREQMQSRSPQALANEFAESIQGSKLERDFKNKLDDAHKKIPFNGDKLDKPLRTLTAGEIERNNQRAAIDRFINSPHEKLAFQDPTTKFRYIFDLESNEMITINREGKRTITVNAYDDFTNLADRLVDGNPRELTGAQAAEFAKTGKLPGPSIVRNPTPDVDGGSSSGGGGGMLPDPSPGGATAEAPRRPNAGGGPGSGRPSQMPEVVGGNAPPQHAYPQPETNPGSDGSEPPKPKPPRRNGVVVEMPSNTGIPEEVRRNNPVPAGGGQTVSIDGTPHAPQDPSTASRVGNGALGGLGVILGASSAYQHARAGHVGGAALGVANAGTSGVGMIEAIKPGAVAPRILQVVEGASVPLMIVGAGYEIATASDEERPEVAAGALAGLGVSGALMAAGASPLVVVALPMGAAWLARKDEHMRQAEIRNNQEIAAIRPDNTGHSHLRNYADSLDLMIKEGEANLRKEGKEVPPDGLKRTADGKIDIYDANNVVELKKIMDKQRAALREGSAQNQSNPVLPNFAESEQKFFTKLAIDKKLAYVTAAESELNAIRSCGPAVERTPAQMEADFKRARDAKVPQINYTYTEMPPEGNIGRGARYQPADDANPYIPEQVRRAHEANPNGGPIRMVTYKRGDNGEVEMVNGEPVPESIVYWNIKKKNPEVAENKEAKPDNKDQKENETTVQAKGISEGAFQSKGINLDSARMNLASASFVENAHEVSSPGAGILSGDGLAGLRNSISALLGLGEAPDESGPLVGETPHVKNLQLALNRPATGAWTHDDNKTLEKTIVSSQMTKIFRDAGGQEITGIIDSATIKGFEELVKRGELSGRALDTIESLNLCDKINELYQGPLDLQDTISRVLTEELAKEGLKALAKSIGFNADEDFKPISAPPSPSMLPKP